MAFVPAETFARLAVVAGRHADLELLVLFGSRARGDARVDSDWDFAYLAPATLDPLALRADLEGELRTDAIDLVDLGRAGGLLRFRAAGEGVAVFERDGAFEQFRLEAIFFWLDAGPVIRAAYEGKLEELDP